MVDKKCSDLQAALQDKDKEVYELRREFEHFRVQAQMDLDKEKDHSKVEAMKRSQHVDDQTEQNILRRRNESLRKENDLLRKQTADLRVQADAVRQSASERDSSHLDPAKTSYELRSVSLKKDQNLQRDLQLKELEVVPFYQIKELKQEKTLLQKEVDALKQTASHAKTPAMAGIEESTLIRRSDKPPVHFDTATAHEQDMARTLGYYLERIDGLTQEIDVLKARLKHETTHKSQPVQSAGDFTDKGKTR